MNTTPKKVWFLLAALALAALLAWISPQPMPPKPTVAHDVLVRFTIVEQMPPTYLAYTQCTQMADSMATISWVRTEVLDTDQENAIVAHEHLHQEQMQRLPSCAAAYAWYRENKITAEAEAYCESARVYHREHPDKVTLDGAVYYYARWLKNYDPVLTLGGALAAIKEFCDKEADNV